MGYVVKTAGDENHTIATALDLWGSFSLGPDPDITLSDETPWVSVSATASGNVDVYRFDVIEPGRVFIDIDGAKKPGGFDSWLELFDSDGNRILWADDGPLDPGSVATFVDRTSDSFIDVELGAGTYYVEVARNTRIANGEPIPRGMTYELQISVPVFTPFNRPPVVPADPIVLQLQTGVTVEAHAVGARDGDSPILTYSLDPGTPVPGTVDFDQAAGTFAFNPSAGFTGRGSFNILIDDGAGGTSVRTVEYMVVRALEGTPGDDSIVGDASVDRLQGLQGSDRLDGGLGNDLLSGGAGNDVLIGGGGRDHAVYASSAAGVIVNLARSGPQDTRGAGVDTLIGLEGIRGSAFDDILRGDDGDNFLYGNARHDWLFGNGGADTLLGGGGRDRLDGGAGADYMDGGRGSDVYLVDDAGDTVSEQRGDGLDQVYSSVNFVLGTGLEELFMSGPARLGTGNEEANRILGTDGANQIRGLGGRDRIHGRGGDDLIEGGDAYDVLSGGDGNDRVHGGEGGGELSGGAGIDRVTGGGGADRLWGDQGDDVLVGGAGWDVLIGGAGEDVMTGGAGRDRFLFGSLDSLTRETADVITDFSSRSDDQIIFETFGRVRPSTFLGTDAFLGDGRARIRYEHVDGDTWVLGDRDGDAVADIYVRLEGEITLTWVDFLLH